MMHRVGLGVMLVMGTVANAAEPARSEPDTSAPANAVPAPASAAMAPAAAAPAPRLSKPLDLRIGDVRKYMLPDEFREAVSAPDADSNTVVVEARRELLPVDYEKPIPTWPLGPLWWGLKNPSQSWRILLPDINRPDEGPRDPEDKVPPPVFRWGP